MHISSKVNCILNLRELKYLIKERKISKYVTEDIEISSDFDRKDYDEENLEEENSDKGNSGKGSSEEEILKHKEKLQKEACESYQNLSQERYQNFTKKGKKYVNNHSEEEKRK